MALTLANATASAKADAATARLDGGSIRLYAGTRPATADTALTDQTLLATLTFGTPAFGAAANGVAIANAITQDGSADATGTAAFARLLTSGGAPVMDAAVSAAGGGGDIELNSTSIQAGAVVSVTSFTYTQPKS